VAFQKRIADAIGMPPDIVPILALALALMVFASWNQSYWWITLEEDHFGWLTPAFALFIIYDRRVAITAAWRACASPRSPRARGAQGWALNGVAIALFTLGILALLAGACHRAGGGPSIKGTFVASFGICLILLTLPFLTAPPTPTPVEAPLRSDARVALCALFLFPALVWLFSEPLVSVAETQLSGHILAPMAALVSHIFDFLGFPITREGNVLLMPDHGRVGVEEACSGIRSFAACVYAGSFLGALMLKKLWQQALLLVVATALALILNFGRSLFLAAWAYTHGTAAIEGTVHDAAGYFVMGLTVIGLFLILTGLIHWARRSHWAPAS
jgi:exosortase/archaeosortase family protein